MILPKKVLFIILFVLLFALHGCQTAAPTASAAVPTATAVSPSAESKEATAAPTLPPVIITVVVTSTPLSEPVVSATEAPPTAAPVEPTQEPTITPLPLEPTSTPIPEPTATATAVPIVGPPWLNLFNHVRAMAGLTAVPELFPLNTGSELHSRYMVLNDVAVAHKEDVNNPLYDPAGNEAAKNGNLFATSQSEANYIWGTNFWISAPFHLIAMLHPGLQAVGYGDYVGDGGDIKMAAVMDVRSDRESSFGAVEYPIFFPGDGTETWVVRHSMYEWPDPLTSCPGYSTPTGAPIIVQLGNGNVTPSVSSFTVSTDGKILDACLFDQTSYRNPDAYAQKIGRTILDEQDAIVILPRQPLAADAEYTVQLVTNGHTYSWSFKTIKRAPVDQ
ncbi:MAG: hypothetical protein H6669_20460 [Ardenticatenaceae bacterium]|nr:hypothetical protein [Ardenticatenaceae bacterium]